MLHFILATLLFTNIACHEPCKNGYGRAADKLCYRLADDPVAPCGEGMARSDDGECVSVTEGDDPYSTAGATGSNSDDGGDTDGGTGGDSTGEDDASSSGGSGAASSGGETGSETSGGSSGGGTDGAGTTGGEPGGSTTIKGVLNTSDGSGFEEGDEVLIQAWSEGSIDVETGLPLVTASARASQFAGAAVTAISIHFEFIVTDVMEGGENLRLTGHLTDDPLDWGEAPVGIYPLDTSAWITLTPGDIVDEVNLIIDNGGDVSAPPGGGPTDTGLPPLGDGGGGDLGPPE